MEKPSSLPQVPMSIPFSYYVCKLAFGIYSHVSAKTFGALYLLFILARIHIAVEFGMIPAIQQAFLEYLGKVSEVAAGFSVTWMVAQFLPGTSDWMPSKVPALLNVDSPSLILSPWLALCVGALIRRLRP